MSIESYRLSQRIGNIEALSESSGSDCLSPLRRELQPIGSNRVTLANKIERIPATNDHDDEEMNNKEAKVDGMLRRPHRRVTRSYKKRQLGVNARSIRGLTSPLEPSYISEGS